MANKEKCEFELTDEKRRAESEAKAREYLYTQKPRKPHFTFTGVIDEGDRGEIIYSTNSLHVDLPHIIQLFIDTYNKKYPSDSPVTTIEELNKKCHLHKLYKLNPELDKFLDYFYDELLMLLYEIDPTERYQYNMSFYCWDPVKKRMSKREIFPIVLSDEEYIYLPNCYARHMTVSTAWFSTDQTLPERSLMLRMWNTMSRYISAITPILSSSTKFLKM